MGLYKRKGSQNFYFAYMRNGVQEIISTRTSDLDEAKAFAANVPSRRIFPTPDPGIYFLHAVQSGLIKIGCSGNLPKRLTELHDMIPEPLILIGTISTPDYRMFEGVIHFQLKACRVKGEWFRLSVIQCEEILERFKTDPFHCSTPAVTRCPEASKSGPNLQVVATRERRH
jgi:hypothetical protein